MRDTCRRAVARCSRAAVEAASREVVISQPARWLRPKIDIRVRKCWVEEAYPGLTRISLASDDHDRSRARRPPRAAAPVHVGLAPQGDPQERAQHDAGGRGAADGRAVSSGPATSFCADGDAAA